MGYYECDEYSSTIHDFMTEKQYKKMNTPKRIKKNPAPKLITKKRLQLRGYKWKIDLLTDEEMDWLQNGTPTDKANVRGPRPDYFYFFKPVEGGECKIHKVGDEFYYNGVKITKMDQIEKCEQLAIDSEKWEKLQGEVKDTEAIAAIYNIPDKLLTSIGTGVVEPGSIRLLGGPMDGMIVKYNNSLPFFMGQIDIGTPDTPNVVAPRYKRSAESKGIYEFDKMF